MIKQPAPVRFLCGRAFCAGLAVLFVVGGTASWALALDEDRASLLQLALASARDSLQATGASACVILPDGSTWTGTSGNAYGSEPVTVATQFEVGSITKAFTAAVILQLASERALRLDDTIVRWAPEVPRSNEITVRQLLNHTSGLADPYDNEAFIPALISSAREPWQFADVLDYLPESVAGPGETWEYSSANYMILGVIIGEETGVGASAAMHSRLFEPLGLQRTILGGEESPSEPIAHAFYDVNGDGTDEDLTLLLPSTAFRTAAWTAGAILSTARDVAVFMRAFVAGDLVPEVQRRAMLTWVDRGDGKQHGLGVLRMQHDGVVLIGHRGNSAGYSGAAWHAPAENITIAVLTNKNGVLVTAIVDALLGAALENSD